MADAYLNIAERVLLDVRCPLRPREILTQAILSDFLPTHLRGPRQDKTLHARLSEDISANPEGSRFCRTAPGVFFLKHFLNDEGIPTAFKSVYLAPPRRKELKNRSILTIEIGEDSLLRGDGRTISVGRLRDLLSGGYYRFQPLIGEEGASGKGRVAVHSFVVVSRGDQVLSFRCGKFFPSNDPLFGKRSIGVGGAVLASDPDLTYDSMWGIIGNGVNELKYGIGLPNRLAERARYENELRPFLGVIIREPGGAQSVMHVVLSYRCPDDFMPTKAALSINDLRWVNALSPMNTLADFDRTSQFLFAQDYIRDLIRYGSGRQ